MIATEITAVREALGLSVTTFAAALGVSTGTVYKWEDSKSPRPKGLSFAVLNALQAFVSTYKDYPDRVAFAGQKLSLGLGALIFYGLTGSPPYSPDAEEV